jgi:hypothetical protein
MIGAGCAVRSTQYECNVERFPAMGKSMFGFVILAPALAFSMNENFVFFHSFKH